MGDVTDDVSDYVIDIDVSDVAEFDVISTNELTTTTLPFDDVTDDVSNHVADFDVTNFAEFDVISTDELTTLPLLALKLLALPPPLSSVFVISISKHVALFAKIFMKFLSL